MPRGAYSPRIASTPFHIRRAGDREGSRLRFPRRCDRVSERSFMDSGTTVEPDGREESYRRVRAAVRRRSPPSRLQRSPSSRTPHRTSSALSGRPGSPAAHLLPGRRAPEEAVALIGITFGVRNHLALRSGVANINRRRRETPADLNTTLYKSWSPAGGPECDAGAVDWPLQAEVC